MNFLKILQSRSKFFYVMLISLGVIRSLTNIGILMLINQTLGGKKIVDFDKYNYLVFILFILVSFLCTSLFQNYMVKLTADIMFKLELSMVDKVRHSSYESFRKIGNDKILSAISDTRLLGRVPQVFITLINSFITIACSLAYLIWVSPVAFVFILAIILCLFALYIYRDRYIEKELNEVRDLQDYFWASVMDLLHGFKQIRISAARNAALYTKHILANRAKAKGLSIRVSQMQMVNELTGVYCWYLVLGVVMFAIPAAFKISVAQMAAFITSILFIMSPVSQLLSFFPSYDSFKIAFERISLIDELLGAGNRHPDGAAPLKKHFESIRFENVLYKYSLDDGATFVLDLAELKLNKEEIVFVTGGNGSGKTTFINILTGLYKPLSGKVFIDEQEISWEEFAHFSNNMAVVFADYYLFRENYDEYDLFDTGGRFDELTTWLHLNGNIELDGEKRKMHTKLSRGQEKRVALLFALLEDKPILILDEWAAEQDQYNRKCFYQEWIADIRRSGKTVIIISHDESFYDTADRVVRFNYGRIAAGVEPVEN